MANMKTTMGELAAEYQAYRARQGYAERTVRQDVTVLGHFARWWDATRRSPRSVDQAAVEEYLFGVEGISTKTQASTFNTKMQHMRAFLRWLSVRGIVKPDAVLAIRTLKPGPRNQFTRLTLAQVVQMIETAEDEWERWALTVASQTLGRDSELIRLQLGHFNFQAGEIDYFRKKTSDEDKVQITPQLDAAYRRWIKHLQEQVELPAQDDWFAIPRRDQVPGPEGRVWKYSPAEARYSLAEVVQYHAARTLGVDQSTLSGQGVHLMRRSMARAAYDKARELGEQDPIRVPMAMLGHKDPRVTELYIGVTAERQRRNKLMSTGELLWVQAEARAEVVQLHTRSG